MRLLGLARRREISSFALLNLLATAPDLTPRMRARTLAQIAHALAWVRSALGVRIGDVQALLAPQHASAAV